MSLETGLLRIAKFIKWAGYMFGGLILAGFYAFSTFVPSGKQNELLFIGAFIGLGIAVIATGVAWVVEGFAKK